MSRATTILERITTISYDFDLKKVLTDEGRPVPKKLMKDMERADKVELRGNGQELTGYIGRKIIFTAAGYVEDEGLDKGHFMISSYFSKEFALSDSLTGGKLVDNTINGEKFSEAYGDIVKHKGLKFNMVSGSDEPITDLLTKAQLDAVVTAHGIFDGAKRDVYINVTESGTRVGFAVRSLSSFNLSGDDIAKLNKSKFKRVIMDSAGIAVYF